MCCNVQADSKPEMIGRPYQRYIMTNPKDRYAAVNDPEATTNAIRGRDQHQDYGVPQQMFCPMLDRFVVADGLPSPLPDIDHAREQLIKSWAGEYSRFVAGRKWALGFGMLKAYAR
jgi:hypothetical protein